MTTPLASRIDRRKAQLDRIRSHLLTGQPIDARSADRLCGCMRLAARIHELRKEGLEITRSTHDPGGYAVYRLVPEQVVKPEPPADEEDGQIGIFFDL